MTKQKSSAVPADQSKIRHTGAGRFAWLTMRPMTLWESGESSGDVSIRALFAEPEKVDGESRLKMEDIAYALICTFTRIDGQHPNYHRRYEDK